MRTHYLSLGNQVEIAERVNQTLDSHLRPEEVRITPSQSDAIRFPDSKKRTPDCWLFVNIDRKGMAYFSFGNYRTGYSSGRQDLGNFTPLSPEEIAERREAEEREKAEKEAKKRRLRDEAESYFNGLPLADSFLPKDIHPYLFGKGLYRSYVARWDRNTENLVVPFYNSKNEFSGYEWISPAGKPKGYNKGASKQNSFLALYDRKFSDREQILVTEGFATGLSAFEAMRGRHIVIIAFDCSNYCGAISSASIYLSNKWKITVPLSRFWILADNDASKAGEDGARKARDALGCHYLLTPILGMDIDDYRQAYGYDATEKFLQENINE